MSQYIKLNRIFLMLTFLFLAATAGFAQEEIMFIGEETGVGARAMGMGGAFVGVADDYSAIYWNPAGLGQIRRMEMNIGFAQNKISNDTGFLGQTYKSEASATRLNSLGFVFPVPTYQGSMVFAMGYNKIRDYDNTLQIRGFNPFYSAYKDLIEPTYYDWGYTTNIDDSLDQDESLVEEGSLNQFVLSGALEVQENFFLGLSLNFTSGADDYNVRLKESDTQNIYNVPFNNSTGVLSDLDYWIYNQGINSDFSATSLKMGGLYKFNKALRIGATITFPTTYTIKEKWSESFDETYDNGENTKFSQEGDFEYKIQHPYALSVGGSFQLVNILLSGGLDYSDWSQAKFKTEPPVSGITKGDINLRIKQDLKAVTKVRLGAEMYVPIIRARVRAGYFNNPSAYRYASAQPDKNYLTAGLSLMLDKQVMVDLSLLRGSWDQETFDPLAQTTTSEEKTFSKMTGTLSIRF